MQPNRTAYLSVAQDTQFVDKNFFFVPMFDNILKQNRMLRKLP